MEGQFLVAQLPVLLEERTAQHRLRRQALPSGLLHPVAAQVPCHKAEQRRMLVQHCEAFFNSQPMSCLANRSNMLACTVRSWRIVGSGADRFLWSQQPKVYLTSSELACAKTQIPQTIQNVSVCGWKLGLSRTSPVGASVRRVEGARVAVQPRTSA